MFSNYFPIFHVADHMPKKPITRRQVIKWGTLSVLGGQIVLPGIYDPTQHVSSYGRKFSRGLVQVKRQPVFVSMGIARLNHLRLCALPDVACITLRRLT